METIGKYRIIRELGKGGFGSVYKGEDPTFGMTVAIKVLNAQDDVDMVRRFRAEAITSAKLRHKNVVTVYDFEEENGVQYLVMEYLDGQNLQELLDHQVQIPALDRLSIMVEVAEGLQYAHDQGVIHRDIKPANIMRLKDGSVKIMDFGIARLTQKHTRLTAVGYLVGTPQYMAPEQFMSDSSDAQCDIWAYGVVLYEFLTGRNPFAAESPGATIYRITNEDPPPICDVVPGLPRSLDPLIRRLLARRKEERYQTLEDVRLDLSPVIQELGEAQVSGMEYSAENLIRSGRYDEALSVAARILKFDQKNTKARKWRIDLRDISKRQAEEARIKVLIEQADAKTTVLDFSAAEAILKEALQLDPNHSAARTKLNQVYAERNKRVRAQYLLAEARSEFGRNALTSAFDHATEAAENDPSNAETAEFLRELRQAIETREAERRCKSGLSRARGLMLVQDYAGAVATLQELAALYPSDTEVTARLQEALHLQSVDASEKKVAAAIAKSRDYLVGGAFQDAINLLAGLDAQGARNAPVQQLLNYAREQLEQQKRDAEVERLLADAAAPKVDCDRALASIARALELSPGNEGALRLRKTLLANRQRDEENNALDAELQGCRELMEADRLDEAQARARALWARYPDHTGVQQIVREIGQRYRRREEAVEREIQSGRREVEALLDRGQVEAANVLLQRLAERYRRESAFNDLRQRASSLEGEMRERDAVNAILARSQNLIDSGRWDDARSAVEQGLKQFPKSAPLQAKRERILAQSEAHALVADIEHKLSRYELDSAVTSAESGIRRFPGDPRLAEMLKKARDLRDWQALLLRAEGQILADQIEEAEKSIAELSRRAPADASVVRLQRLLDDKRQRRRNLEAVDQLRKRLAFQEARTMLQGLLRADPGDLAAQTLLEAVERESVDHKRTANIIAARAEAARLSKSKDFAAAVQVLTRIAHEYPDDADIQEDLRRARESRDQSMQKEAYSAGCRELDSLMRAREFDRAIAKARELIAAFPAEADLQDDLLHATEARDQAVRRELYSIARRELSGLLKNRIFDQAVEKAQELIAAFPEESELQDDLRRAREGLDQYSRKRAYDQARNEIDALLKNRHFDRAIARLEQLIGAFPEEAELLDELRRARASQEGTARKEAYAKGRKEFDALMKNRNFVSAVALAEKLIAEFPNEQELTDDLRRARAARDQSARQEAYAKARKGFEELIRNRNFDQAVTAAEQLIAAFPEEPELQDLLRRTRDARDQAVRKTAFERGCGEFDGLMRNRQFDQAIAKAQELCAAFPEESLFQDELKRAVEARGKAARQAAYDQRHKEFDALMKAGKLAEAIAKAEALSRDFPDDPVVQQDLMAAKSAHQVRQRGAELEAQIAELEVLFRKGDVDAVRKRAQSILQRYDDPRAKELLKWADRSQTDLKAIKREAAPSGYNKRLLYLAGPAAAVLLAFGIYELVKPRVPGQLRVSPQELSFTYRMGDSRPALESFVVAGPAGTSWTIKPSDPWFNATPATQTGKVSVSVSVVPDGLGAGDYSGIATITAPDGSANEVTVKVKLKVIAPASEVARNESTPSAIPPPAKDVQQAQQISAAAKKSGTPSDRKAPAQEPGLKKAEPKGVVPHATEAAPAAAPSTPPPPPAATPRAPLEPAVDCHAANYIKLTQGTIKWLGVLEPRQSVTIDRHNRAGVGTAGGDHLPGCAVTVKVLNPQSGSLTITQPAAGDNYSTLTIRNTSTTNVNGAALEWEVR